MSGGISEPRPDPAFSVSCDARGRKVVDFTHHAHERMQERGVSLADVVAALQRPDQEGLPADPPRLRVRRMLSQQVALDVVFEELPDRLLVVTVVRITRRISGRF